MLHHCTQPTRKPTRKPTRSSSSSTTSRSRNRGRCRVDDDRPRPVRDGERFRFNLVRSNAQCVDINRNLYEYGEFKGIRSSPSAPTPA